MHENRPSGEANIIKIDTCWDIPTLSFVTSGVVLIIGIVYLASFLLKIRPRLKSGLENNQRMFQLEAWRKLAGQHDPYVLLFKNKKLVIEYEKE